MPNYTYVCECEQEIELNHPMDLTPEIHCPDCKALMRKSLGGKPPAGIVRGGDQGYRVPVQKTGDPVIDHEDKDITERVDHELKQLAKRRRSR